GRFKGASRAHGHRDGNRQRLTMAEATPTDNLRHRVYEILEHGPIGDHVARFVSRGLVLLIIVNLIAVALESVPELNQHYSRIFFLIELVSLILFTIEYLLRLWIVVEHEHYQKSEAWRVRMKYALSPGGIIDLLAVAPFWVSLITGADLRVLLVFR